MDAASKLEETWMTNPDWQRYEKTATYVLNEVASYLGLQRVEGKQSISGDSGTDWEIDAKGVSENGEAFVIVECRRYTKSRLSQEDLGGIAYRIRDGGAEGGIVVSPLGLQEGAAKVAKKENIVSVRLPADCTPQRFALEFLGNLLARPLGVESRCEVGSVTVITTSHDRPQNGS